jgi:hypothetical protein
VVDGNEIGAMLWIGVSAHAAAARWHSGWWHIFYSMKK